MLSIDEVVLHPAIDECLVGFEAVKPFNMFLMYVNKHTLEYKGVKYRCDDIYRYIAEHCDFVEFSINIQYVHSVKYVLNLAKQLSLARHKYNKNLVILAPDYLKKWFGKRKIYKIKYYKTEVD